MKNHYAKRRNILRRIAHACEYIQRGVDLLETIVKEDMKRTRKQDDEKA